jgi:hypothetical protein
MSDAETLPLEGLYLHLVRAGFALSVRDYTDALAALRRGHGVGRRDRLLWLATTLWARGDLEVSRIEALFRQFAPPSSDEVRALVGDAGAADAAWSAGPPAAPLPESGGAGGGAAPASAPLLEFSAAVPGTGGLPVVRHVREPARHYVFEPRPLVSQRALTIAWRRFRRAQRSGPRTELDVDATIAERCRSGWLLEPVLVAPRRNQARLVVLVDASASMLPWRATGRLVAASLPAGLLAHTRLLYFDNDPREGLYEHDGLTGHVALDAALRQEADCVALVVGDAGAARGRLDRERVAGTGDFLRRARGRWPAIAWLNPMPRRRWAGSSAERSARDPGCAMFEFTEDGLTRAVDVLRGAGGR